MSLRKSVVWTTSGQVILFFVQFGSQVALARILTPYEFGISAIGFSVAGLINILQALGLKNLIVRAPDLSPKLLDTIFTINILLGGFVAFVVLACSILGGALFNEPGVSVMLSIVAILPLINALDVLPSGMLQRELKFGPVAFASVCKACAAATAAIALALHGASYKSIAYGAICGSVASVLVHYAYGYRYVSFRVSLQWWRSVAKFGSQMVAISGVSNLSARLVDLLIAKLLGLEALGLFSRAAALNAVIWDNLHIVLSRVAFSGLAEERRRTGRILEGYLSALDWVTALLWPAFAGLAILAGPVVHLLYGAEWSAVAPILQIFAAAAIVLTSLTMLWEVFVVAERTGEQARLEFIRAGSLTVLSLCGAFFNLHAVAAARLADAVVAILLYRGKLTAMTGASDSHLAGIFFRNGALTVLAVSPAIIAMTLNEWQSDIPLRFVVSSVAGGIALWFSGAMLLNHRVVQEIRALARAFFVSR